MKIRRLEGCCWRIWDPVQVSCSVHLLLHGSECLRVYSQSSRIVELIQAHPRSVMSLPMEFILAFCVTRRT